MLDLASYSHEVFKNASQGLNPNAFPRRHPTMLRDYDIFEKFPDGSTIWRACVFGQYEARRKLQDLAERSPNEFVAIDIKAGEPLPAIAMRSNSREQISKQSKRVA
jgi:hypothetical protein